MTSTVSSQLQVSSLVVTTTTSEKLVVHRVILKQCSQLFDGACKGFFILKKLHKCTKLSSLNCLLEVKSPSSSMYMYVLNAYYPRRIFFSQHSSVTTWPALFLALIATPRIRNTKHALVKLHDVTQYIPYTVKPPNKGHIGDGPVVPCREIVLFSEVFF